MIKKTSNLQRNYYLNKMKREGLESTNFVKDAAYNYETDNITKNLKQGLYYKNKKF
ncbi:MAG TPA: hypothetical protein PLG10_02325 [Candidatus Dojkabacteria bacterium]|nr:hypothetical protein [Candidatus Dojkabacteria bacterium]